MKNINNITQWKNGSVDVTFARAITHQKHLVRSGRSLGAVRGVQWTFSIHSAYLLKSQSENKKLKLECMNADYALNLVWHGSGCLTTSWILNNDKREFIVLGSKYLHDKVNILHFCIGNSSIAPASKVRNLGAYFDMDMTLNQHISEILQILFIFVT